MARKVETDMFLSIAHCVLSIRYDLRLLRVVSVTAVRLSETQAEDD